MLPSFKYQNQAHYCFFAEETELEHDIIALSVKDPTDSLQGRRIKPEQQLPAPSNNYTVI